jgi:hypothetical protein
MKKIINGRRYYTDTSVECGEYEYGKNGTSEHYSEVLYRKSTGEFFIHGVGGPASPYAVEAEINSWKGGEAITPLTDEEARKWAEKHLSADECKKIFTVQDDEKPVGRKLCSFSLTKSVIEKLAELSHSSGISRSRIVADLINGAYEERKKAEH